MSDQSVLFANICRRNGLLITDKQLALLRGYVQLLLEWNTRVNLISRRDTELVWLAHILHSVSVLFYFDMQNGVKMLDIGTGGGLPGIPIAILKPGVHISLLDSIQKKTRAVSEIAGALQLGNVSVLTSRAEELGERHQYDVVVARAVAPLEALIRWSRPLLRRQGSPGVGGARSLMLQQQGREFQFPLLLALKGGDLEGEIAKARLKTGEKKITSISLTFEGSTEIGLEEKKLLVVEL